MWYYTWDINNIMWHWPAYLLDQRYWTHQDVPMLGHRGNSAQFVIFQSLIVYTSPTENRNTIITYCKTVKKKLKKYNKLVLTSSHSTFLLLSLYIQNMQLVLQTTKKLEIGKTSYRICKVKYLFIVFISYY